MCALATLVIAVIIPVDLLVNKKKTAGNCITAFQNGNDNGTMKTEENRRRDLFRTLDYRLVGNLERSTITLHRCYRVIYMSGTTCTKWARAPPLIAFKRRRK